MKQWQSATVAFYNKNADRWASERTNSFFHEARFRKFIKYFKKGSRILDIGCAYGIHVPLFLGIGRKLKYEGMDLSRNMVRIAKSRYPGLSFGVANIADQKTLSRQKYNGFWSAATLMHIPKEEFGVALANIENTMRPGAIGYITLPEKRSRPVSKLRRRPFTLFTLAQIKTTINPRGWQILKYGKIVGFNKKKTWRWLIMRLP